MLRLDTDRPDADVLWRVAGTGEMPDQTQGLHSLITTPVIEGDTIYGVGSYGELRGLDATTGERLWVSDRNDRAAPLGRRVSWCATATATSSTTTPAT